MASSNFLPQLPSQSEPITSPLAFTVGSLRSVLIMACMKEVGTPQFHMVMTMLRSVPSGRGGTGGNSPLAMRSPQSAYIARVRSRPILSTVFIIDRPTWPEPINRIQAWLLEENLPRFAGISRVDFEPMLWQVQQALKSESHSP